MSLATHPSPCWTHFLMFLFFTIMIYGKWKLGYHGFISCAAVALGVIWEFVNCVSVISATDITQEDKNHYCIILCWHSMWIGHFGKYHNNLCPSPQTPQKHCLQFLLGLAIVPRENKNNAYVKFGGTNQEYYGIFQSGPLWWSVRKLFDWDTKF